MNHILVTGGTGMVGNAIKKVIDDQSVYTFLSSRDCDLTDYNATRDMFEYVKPDYVIHLAACVGGLYRNMNNKVEMLEKNLMINFNVLKCCHESKVKRCVSCLSTCIFPNHTTFPIDESMLHQGPPHESNDAYAYAKRMLEIHSKAYRENYGDDFVCVIPTNIYGTHDNYNLRDAHVIPALIHRCYLNKSNGEPFVVRGTGKPLRQFIFADDLAQLILWTLKSEQSFESIILSVSEKDEQSIEQVARKIAQCFDYEHMIRFDDSYADGQYKKTADNSLLIKHNDFKFTDFDIGIAKSVEWFIDNYNNGIRL